MFAFPRARLVWCEVRARVAFGREAGSTGIGARARGASDDTRPSSGLLSKGVRGRRASGSRAEDARGCCDSSSTWRWAPATGSGGGGRAQDARSIRDPVFDSEARAVRCRVRVRARDVVGDGDGASSRFSGSDGPGAHVFVELPEPKLDADFGPRAKKREAVLLDRSKTTRD